MPICMCASTQPGNASRFRASKTSLACSAWISGARRAIFPFLTAMSRQSTDALFGRTTRAFLMTRSNDFSMVFSVLDRARLFDDRRPPLDVLAHEGGEVGRRIADGGSAFIVQPLAQPRIVERGDNDRVQFAGDRSRKIRRREHAEPGSRFEPG